MVTKVLTSHLFSSGSYFVCLVFVTPKHFAVVCVIKTKFVLLFQCSLVYSVIFFFTIFSFVERIFLLYCVHWYDITQHYLEMQLRSGLAVPKHTELCWYELCCLVEVQERGDASSIFTEDNSQQDSALHVPGIALYHSLRCVPSVHLIPNVHKLIQLPPAWMDDCPT